VTFQVGGPSLTVDPAAVPFSATIGGPAPEPRQLRVAANPEATIEFSAASGCGWLSMVPSGTATPATLLVSATAAGMTAGTYTCPVVLKAPEAANVAQPVVTLKVSPTSIRTSPSAIALNAAEGSSTPVVGAISVIGPEAPVEFTAGVQNAAWLTVDPATATTPSLVRVQANPAGLKQGIYSATVHVVSAGAALAVPVTLTVAAVSLRAVPSALAFHFEEGTEPAAQAVSLLASDGSAVKLAYQTSGQIRAADGPGSANVSVSAAAGLKAGAYGDNVLTLKTGGAEVAVRATVTVDPPVRTLVLNASPNKLSFSVMQDAPASTQLVVAASQGGEWTPRALAKTDRGGAWLGVAELPAKAASGAAVPIAVTVDPRKLNQTPGGDVAGVSTGQVIVLDAGTGQEIRVPLTMTVNPRPGFTLSRQGLSFTAALGKGTAPAETLDVANSGLVALKWTATASTLSGGGWLKLGQAAGDLAPGATFGVPVSVDPATVAELGEGVYYGLVEVRAAAAASSPRMAGVVLNVLREGTGVSPAAHPGTLIFPAAGQQSLTLVNPNGGAMGFRAAAVTEDGGDWCSVTPPVGSVTDTASLTVRVETGSLATGIHRCSVQLSYSDGSSQQAGVVAMAGIAAEACSPAGLVVS
ncbi:MAG: hypothetical protein NTY38_23700, partial [Acidobacteria bacterium]|nr:hypothetical protein [Acidobacteriota bacterium]